MQLSQCQLCSFLVFRCSLFLFFRAHSRPWLCRSSPSATPASFSTSSQVHVLQPPSPLHKYTSTSSTASTGTHHLPAPHPLQVYILCKSTSSTSPHLCHFRLQAMRSYAKQLQILKSNFTRKNWGAVTGTTMEFSIRWEIYLLFCHKLLKMKCWRSFWLLEMLFSHFSHDLSRELVTKINYSGAIILPSVMRWPMEPLKTLKS